MKKPACSHINELIHSVYNGEFCVDASYLQIKHSIDLSGLDLTSLDGIPTNIDGSVTLSKNSLTTLKDIHTKIHSVNGVIRFVDCPIRSNILGLLKIKGLQGIILSPHRLELQMIINRYIFEGDIFECQRELIDKGYEAFAQL